MITAVDTNVLLDILAGQEPQARQSARALLLAQGEGAVVAADVVWAETCTWFATTEEMSAAMSDLGVSYDPAGLAAAALAGGMWRAYRLEGGSRARLVPDFLVGAHAQAQTDRLLTRDRGFFRRYFTDLVIVDASTVAP